MRKIEIKPIGIIHSIFKRAKGTPIQSAFADDAEGIIEVFDKFTEGLKDLDGFERIWLIYWFDRAKDYSLTVVPYMDTQKRGLFATRAPARPNPIGISSVKLEKIEVNKIYVSGLDILDKTPLLDIKPYISKIDCFKTGRNGWLKDMSKKNHKADDRFCKE
ncbi:MAG: tRNA (N6-threonylcarbamoyladenosine(37)-N6)-methyltransferase TrmO [Planctomycetota bacterium]|jgi:tRNA-Thr(GGU) m(6)t(6)A37 methyltransferase TsaA